jgi:hypothetical protein
MHPAVLNFLVLSGIIAWGWVMGKVMIYILDRT